MEHINKAGVNWQTLLADDPESLMALFFGGATHDSRRFTGFYNAPTAGKYIVVLEGPGEGSGNRVYLDDKLVIDNWKIVRAFQPHLTVELSAGLHKVVVEDSQHNPIGGRLRFGIIEQSKIVDAKAVELAAKADVVLVAAGYQFESEGEGGDRTFELPFGQDELINAMAGANKKTIVSITSGGNVDSRSWIGQVPAVLESWYAGQEGGTALAEILLGQVNPSGHLPATFERSPEDNPTFANYYPEGDSKRVVYKEGIFVGYRGYEHNHTKPLFPFGYGLSYTTFKFANLSLDASSKGSNPRVTVSFDLTNTGGRAGAEVAQVYVGDEHAKVARPAHELKGFERVQLAAGETKHVSVELDSRAFAYYDVAQKRWTIDPGKFNISVGDSVETLELKGAVELSREAANTVF